MNIAALIGISNYRVAEQLPACSKDVAEMRRLLFATGKYDDIFIHSTNTEAASLKDALRGFFRRHTGSDSIQEALVYFSGHGVYHNNDVLLCCSDFDLNRPASTSLSNTELDDLLRSVGPKVAVKILDACQSGSQYIKEAAPGFEKALRESQLASFICMASSRSDQSSYASAECSVFTSRLIDAALSKAEGLVLYRDIQAALADSFVATPEQTPFFVVQGTGLESFAQVTPEMRALQTARSATQAIVEPENTLAASISEQVQRMDTLYVPVEVAKQAIDEARTGLERAPLSHPLVSRFYEKHAVFDRKLATLPGAKELAKFASEQAWEKKYFVRIVQEPRAVRVAKDPWRALRRSITWSPDEVEYVTRVVHEPSQLEPTETLPFEVAEVRFEPKAHPSLKSFVTYIGLAHSLTELVVLSASARLLEAGWTQRSIDVSQIKFQQQSHLWKDVVQDPEVIWREPLARAQEAIQGYLEGLIPRKEEAKPAVAGPGEAIAEKSSPNAQS
ncbi:MAG: caspase family protein [Terriglobia bacterium]|jgi:hypothetical protein